jgi:membrane protease YdiL (CAAX protease family)
MSARSLPAVEPAKGWQPWGALVPFLGIAFVASTVISLTTVLQYAGLVDDKENPIGLIGFICFLLFPFVALGIVVLGWVCLVERRPLTAIGLGGAHRTRTFLSGHLVGAAMVMVIVAGIWIAGGFHMVAVGPAFHSSVALGSIAILLVCFALQSSVEELLFRGWMLSSITAKFGVVFAVVISSAVFELLHFDSRANWIFVTNVFLFAVFACCWVIRTGNVWGVMGWHGGWNWMLAVGFELRVTALDAHLPALLVKLIPVGPDYLTGGIQGPEGSIVCTLALTCGIAYHLSRARRKWRYLPSGVDTSVPAGGANSNIDAGTGPRV